MKEIILKNNSGIECVVIKKDDLLEHWRVISITYPKDSRLPVPFANGWNEIKVTEKEVLVTRYRVSNNVVTFVDIDTFKHVTDNVYKEAYSGGYSVIAPDIDTAKEGT